VERGRLEREERGEKEELMEMAKSMTGEKETRGKALPMVSRVREGGRLSMVQLNRSPKLSLTRERGRQSTGLLNRTP
jgi:hypothetical protein